MADIADDAGDYIEKMEEAAIAAHRAAAAAIPEGVEGECWECGIESKRLVNDLCAPCRDKTC